MSDEYIIRLPYLHDHHSHVSLYAALDGQKNLDGLGAAASLELLRRLPREDLSLVTGWRSDRLTLGAAELAGMPPAIIVNSSLHGFALTPSAAPIVAELWPELAELGSDPDWGEHKLGRLFAFYGRVAGLDAAKLERFMAKMEALGIGSLDDMTILDEEALALVSSSRFADHIVPWATPETYRELSPDSRSRCAGIKIYLDGSLGARSASLNAPFSDGSVGSLLYSDSGLMALLSEVAGYGTGLSAHALGHRCIEQVLRCLEALRRDGVSLASIRLEHLQFISLDQARRCKELGIRLSMQPNFNADSVDYADRLIERHRAENDPFRMLIDRAGFEPGKDLVLGSDGMPHGPEFGLRWSLFPAYEGQALEFGEFAAGYGVGEGLAGRQRFSAGEGSAFAGEGSAFAIDPARRAVRRMLS